MYVCVCNAIRECDFRNAGCRVEGDAGAVYEALGKRPQCGCCLEDADTILAEERACGRRLRLVAA